MTRDDAWDLLSLRCERLGRDELRVLAEIAKRLTSGLVQYGPLDVHSGRNWRREAAEEAMDALVYTACDFLCYELALSDTEPAPPADCCEVIIVDDADIVPDAAPTQPDTLREGAL